MVQCPRCHKDKLDEVDVRNALSRRDNKTYICSDCGNEEAFIDAGLIAETINEAVFVASLRLNKEG